MARSARRLLFGGLFVAALAGCNGSSSGYAGSAPPPTTLSSGGFANPNFGAGSASSGGLIVQVTNSSCATIDVTADTPDETVDFGLVGPGETISVDLSEVPPYAVLDSTVVALDGCDTAPTFAEDTIDEGVDYTSQDSFVAVDWTDPTDPSTFDTSSSDPSGDPSSDPSTDPSSSDTSQSVAAGSTARTALASGELLPRKAARIPGARIATPTIVKKGAPAEPTPTAG